MKKQSYEELFPETALQSTMDEELRDMLSIMLADTISNNMVQQSNADTSSTANNIQQSTNVGTSTSTGSSGMQGSKVWVNSVPDTASAHDLAKFLEGRIKKPGAVARCKLWTDRDSNKRTGGAIVHFKTHEDAKYTIMLARTQKLIFRKCRLEAFPSNSKKARKRGNIDGPTAVNNTDLHIGSLVKKDVLYKLCTFRKSKIEVDNIRKIFRIIIHTSFTAQTYKLEWRLRDIHEFCRCKSRRNHPGQTFMLRVFYTPQIYELSINENQYVCEELSGLSWDDQYEQGWVRTTDFSPKASIGQSYVYCIEISPQHAGVLDYLVYTDFEFQFQEKNLFIENGSSYSASLQTVPILNSPCMNGLPFELVFLVNSLVQQGYLSGPSLGWNFFHHISPSMVVPLEYIVHVLEKLRRKKDTCFEPELQFEMEVDRLFRYRQKEMLTKSFLDDGLMMVHRVQVTPSRVYCMGPEVDVSNRVTRHFIDHIDDFLRVTFVEEDFDLLRSSALVVPAWTRSSQSAETNQVYSRIVSVLNDGITIGKKKFEFLAFSTSQLRENSVWMFSSNAGITAADIRNWMGDFLEIRNVAKCASRMGQSFSSSTKSLDVPTSEIEKIDDVWNDTHTYCFSDGIGKISAGLATTVAKKSKLKRYGKIPSLYQIRYGGYKGVVAVDPTSHYKLSLRPTMHKFESSQIGLDILNWSRIMPSYLNREIITVLCTLGVPDSVFEKMQEEMMQQLEAMFENEEVAVDVIQAFCGGSDTHQTMVKMLEAGFHPASEPFLMRMLQTFRALQLWTLRRKSHIFVPKGRLLMGCLDETKTLDYGQVFISVSPTSGANTLTTSTSTSEAHTSTIDDGLHIETVSGINNVPQSVCIVKGTVIVAKNPCVHPGDIRVLTAVDVPALHHLVDCIVFPQKGPRSHPSECSGSDLDGDLYFVSWDKNLIPPQVHDPQDYQPAPAQILDRQITTQDIIKYFADFMVNNSLGLLSNAHVVHADRSPEMACDPKCLELARLCSIAVDFPKTGVVAVLPSRLRPKEYPDFMEKPDKPEYESERVLGKLYRAVIEVGLGTDEEILSFTKREAEKCYDKELEVNGFTHYLKAAVTLKHYYDEKLLYLMYQYDVKSEAEMFTGNTLSLSKWVLKRPGDVKERMLRAMGALKREARSWLKDDNANRNNDDEEENTNRKNEKDDDDDDKGRVSYEQLAKASAWYHVTYHPRYVPDQAEDKLYGHLISFPWVAYRKLVFIKKWGRGLVVNESFSS